MDPELLAAAKALTDPTRLRIVGQLARGAASADGLVDAAGLPLATVVRQLGLLERTGLVTRAADGRYSLAPSRLAELGRALDGMDASATSRARPDDPLLAGLSDEDARVVRGYLVDGRLVALPSTDSRRMPVLRWLRDRVFTEDRDYTEPEVNQAIALVHPDVASLRRYLVDARLVTRAAGRYRRVGDTR